MVKKPRLMGIARSQGKAALAFWFRRTELGFGPFWTAKAGARADSRLHFPAIRVFSAPGHAPPTGRRPSARMGDNP
jgi:hypothetical protein